MRVESSTHCALHRLMLWLPVSIILGGCAGNFEPKPVDDIGFRERSETQTERGISVTAAVPSARETREMFDVSLYRKGIQPVWLKIENDTDEAVLFFPVGVDDEYHSPFEVASVNRNQKAREQAEQYFFQSGVDVVIDPGETREGFLFTNRDEGTKAFNVDVISNTDDWMFTFFIPVPGLAVDHYDVDFDALYPKDEITDFTDTQAFIDALTALPCCTTDSAGETFGDPLNIVIIGDPLDIYYAVIRAGWDETEVVTAASGWKTAMSFITGGEYRYSPVSSLYVFGRRQDIALQRIRDNIHERNHFRLWLAPMTYEGRQVWIGQISRDIGVRFTTKTITTHKIDPDVDETREYLLENLAYAQMVENIAYVGGVGEAPIDEPRGNLTGDPYFTDGLRVVMWIATEPVALEDIGYEEWIDPES